MEYVLHVIVLAGIYIMLSVSLDLLVGQTGLLSLAHAGFYALGAYASAILTTAAALPFGVGVITGVAAAVTVAVVLSLCLRRLHDEYFVVATFGFQIILTATLTNWVALTRGPLGIRNIPRPEVLGQTVDTNLGYAILVCAAALASCVLMRKIASSPMGGVLRAIREDEVLVESLGLNTVIFKAAAFALSAGVAATAGSLYAHYMSYIDSTNFTVTDSISILAMVIVGGAGRVSGAIVGAITLVCLPELLRTVGIPNAAAGNTRQVLYGLMLILIMLRRPSGLLGSYDFGR